MRLIPPACTSSFLGHLGAAFLTVTVPTKNIASVVSCFSGRQHKLSLPRSIKSPCFWRRSIYRVMKPLLLVSAYRNHPMEPTANHEPSSGCPNCESIASVWDAKYSLSLQWVDISLIPCTLCWPCYSRGLRGFLLTPTQTLLEANATIQNMISRIWRTNVVMHGKRSFS